MTEIFWTSRADADLDAIFNFAARNSEDYALLLVQRILGAVKRLKDFPLSGRSVPEFERPDIREVILVPYRIVQHLAQWLTRSVRHWRPEGVATDSGFHRSESAERVNGYENRCIPNFRSRSAYFDCATRSKTTA